MLNHNQDGAANGLALAFVATILLLILAVIFGIWAYGSRQDYKNNVTAQVNQAVNAAVAKEDQLKNDQFAAQENNSLTTYVGPQAYGSLTIKYPKTWSGYVDTSGDNNAALSAYFNPGVVPSVANQSSIFALTVQVLSQTYVQTVQDFTQQGSGLTVSAYSLPKLPKVVGVEVSGNISGQNNETLVVLPLRSETLEIGTEGSQYLSVFNNTILANFSFSP